MAKRISNKPRQPRRIVRTRPETATAPPAAASAPRPSVPGPVSRPPGLQPRRDITAGADYSYVTRDLVRITIIALVLLGGMGVLKAVIG